MAHTIASKEKMRRKALARPSLGILPDFLRSHNPELVAERMRIYAAHWRALVFEHYGKSCNCCHQTTPQFLTIDHVNNDGFLEKNASGKKLTGAHLYRKIVINEFPNSYQILCMNCNHGKRMNGGVCPHKTI